MADPMTKLLNTTKRHRRTTPIPVSPPEPDMGKLLHTGATLGRKRRRIASGFSGASALPPVNESTAMEVDPPRPAPVHADAGRSPSVEIIAGPFPVTTAMEVDPPGPVGVTAGVARSPSLEVTAGPFPVQRRPHPTSRPNPVDPPTSPMHFSSASEEPTSSSDESLTPQPRSPQFPVHQTAPSNSRKRTRSVMTATAGPSSGTTSRGRPTHRGKGTAVPPVLPAGMTVPAQHVSGAALSQADKGKRKASPEELLPRERWPTPPPLNSPTDDKPLLPQSSGSGRLPDQPSEPASTRDHPKTAMNPAAWHPYTGGGPGLVRSMDRFEAMMKATRDYEKQFIAKMHKVTLTPGNPATDHLVNAYHNIQADQRRNLTTLNSVMEARDRMKFSLDKIDACLDSMMKSRDVPMPDHNL